jgi:mevalonate kinase
VAAPGSVLLLGEYAVTEPDAPGVALAVLPEVHAVFDPSRPPYITGRMRAKRFDWTPRCCDSPLFAALVAECGPPHGSITVDSTEFAGPHGKLGLGSSAAVAVVVAALLLARQQRHAQVSDREATEVATQARAATKAEGGVMTSPGILGGEADVGDSRYAVQRRRVFAAALAAHRAAQGGRGSGYDVATSVWGGVVRFRGGCTPLVSRYRPPALPELHLVTGARPLATPAAVARYEQWRQRDPAAAERFRKRSHEVVEQFLAATEAAACCATLAAGGELVRWLGERIGVTVEPPDLRTGLDQFRACGWAAKPVGAGGELGVAAAPAGTIPPAVQNSMPLRLAPEGLRWLN